MVTVATWNVNSIKPRLGHLVDWLGEAQPDIALLQETKTVDESFPREALEDAGYNVATCGQKTYNGVAILAKRPIDVTAKCLPGDDNDPQARYIEAIVGTVRVASIYLPNGNPVGTEKYTYKLAWMERLRRHVQGLLATEDAFVLGGDYNVTFDDGDVYDPEGWRNDALCLPPSRQALRRIVHLGLTDAVRAIHHELHCYSWWDYQAGAWSRDHGLRIDHLLLSPQAADRLEDSGIDKSPRGRERPSDHTPVWCRLTGD